MAVDSVTLYDAMMKETYTAKKLYDVSTRNRTFLSMVPKSNDLVGDKKVIPIMYGNPQGVSADASLVYSQSKGGGSRARFELTRSAAYAAVNMSGELLYASKNDKGAFKKAFRVNVDGMLDQLGHHLSLALYRNGGGAIAAVSSWDDGNNQFTVSTADAGNLRVGMKIVSGDTDGTSGAANSGTAEITAINEETGLITHDGNATFETNNGSATHIFVEGDFGSKLKGLDSFIPATAGTLYGLDQTAHREMLAGTYVSDTSYSIEEAILVTAEKVAKRGGKPDVCFISHENFTQLVLGRESKVVEQGAGGEAAIGFRGFPIHYSGGMLYVYPDPDCPDNAGYVLTLNTWELSHMEGLPHIVTDDGLRALRNSGDDSIEIRGRYWAALGCYAPAHNGRFAR